MTFLVISKDNDFFKTVHPVPTVRNPRKTFCTCRHGHNIFKSCFCNRQGINLPLCDNQLVELVIALIHSKQNRLRSCFTPFLISPLFLGILRVSVFDKLQFSILVIEREHKDVFMLILYCNLILFCHPWLNPSIFQIFKRWRLRNDFLFWLLQCFKLLSWLVILINFTSKRKIKVLCKRNHVSMRSAGSPQTLELTCFKIDGE